MVKKTGEFKMKIRILVTSLLQIIFIMVFLSGCTQLHKDLKYSNVLNKLDNHSKQLNDLKIDDLKRTFPELDGFTLSKLLLKKGNLHYEKQDYDKASLSYEEGMKIICKILVSFEKEWHVKLE